jgi:hypothetical protein
MWAIFFHEKSFCIGQNSMKICKLKEETPKKKKKKKKNKKKLKQVVFQKVIN